MENVWMSSYGEGVPGNLDYESITMPDMLKRNATNLPKGRIIEFAGTRITFKAFDEEVNQVANGFIALGVGKGDRVALLLPNIPQIAIATYAAWRIGAVVVMNNPLYKDAELIHQFNDSGATLLVALDLLVPRMLALKEKTGLKSIIVAHTRTYIGFPKKQFFKLMASDQHMDFPPQPDLIEWSTLLKSYSKKSPFTQVNGQDIASIQYTVGTTGRAKGLVLSHDNLSKNCQQGIAWLTLIKTQKTVVLGSLPIFHSFGLFVLNLCVRMGVEMVMLPLATTEEVIKAIPRNGVTLFPAGATLFMDILNHPRLKQYDLSSLELCISGAAPCPLDVLGRFEQLTGAPILEGYGLSEASPVVAMNPLNGKNKPGTVGLPYPDTVVKITDVEDPDREMGIGELGELTVKGPQVALGYHNLDEETVRTFRKGWLHTGDVATMDEEGYITIVDRIKNRIVTGGQTVYPREIDEVLFSHPKIVEACVKGVPDSTLGEVVKAFVVIKPGEVLDEADLHTHCKNHLAPHKVPTIFEYMDELPKSSVGKILRKRL
ncbi:FadD1 [Desulforapulum autotrophicum HRM2]|uniref:FadD1 n=1 Tax=Desulforapulum autotrophicum (strain ATCC 43914 / DSM 3382 / VKM B-1955 / HRM2) TaxID=177437 RepID=C0QGI4_DESAH|nr:long-chain fatty acid--CoA ligase [Desulforapulum autotrophicum]ACN13459.1 FadD1 [Desulforapulum autotrophicum HRM2]